MTHFPKDRKFKMCKRTKITRARCIRLPRNGKSFFTVMSLHINNQFAKKRGIGKKLEEHEDLDAKHQSPRRADSYTVRNCHEVLNPRWSRNNLKARTGQSNMHLLWKRAGLHNIHVQEESPMWPAWRATQNTPDTAQSRWTARIFQRHQVPNNMEPDSTATCNTAHVLLHEASPFCRTLPGV